MSRILSADIGSTYTKLRVMDLTDFQITASAAVPTTADTNAAEGFFTALDVIYDQCGKKTDFSHKLAASSAAGGLKMISVGLVPSLSANAAKLAASSAGAKVLKSYSYELSQAELTEIAALKPDIILLSGGIDGGNKDCLLHNAEMLAQTTGDICVIVAGNKSAADTAARLIESSGKKAVITENVLPEYGRINIAPAREVIRALFIERIIHAKGLDDIQSFLTGKIIPTPLAVFNALDLLSRGTAQSTGWGELMAFDVGGATTDVYSMAEGAPQKANVTLKGLQEPFAKRSVEADIGMRYSLKFLVEEAGFSNILARLDSPAETLADWIDTCVADPTTLPGSATSSSRALQSRIETELAAWAVDIAADRHCGVSETVYTPLGEAFIQTGKDLSEVKTIIGSGGVIINSEDHRPILARALVDFRKPHILRPREAKLLLDKHNILTAAGLIAHIDPEAALALMKKSLVER